MHCTVHNNRSMEKDAAISPILTVHRLSTRAHFTKTDCGHFQAMHFIKTQCRECHPTALVLSTKGVARVPSDDTRIYKTRLAYGTASAVMASWLSDYKGAVSASLAVASFKDNSFLGLNANILVCPHVYPSLD